jgi:hypothetical protein
MVKAKKDLLHSSGHALGRGTVSTQWGYELRTYTLSHPTSPFFVMCFFKIGSLELFVWLQTVILLISAS